ncbi:MAG: glycoside hydrolase [Gammaproteobacteria bacterium]|nr:glycoside hydrolase [Gammaproteobacteria bacterium]
MPGDSTSVPKVWYWSPRKCSVRRFTTSAERLPVVLCWHMHQPSYFDPIAGSYVLPWTYLHAIKDYVDMAAHLEAHPAMRAVVNFSPTLLEQLDDYNQQLTRWRVRGEPIADPLLAALAEPRAVTDATERRRLIELCLRAHPNRVIARFPPYLRLYTLAQNCLQDSRTLAYLSDEFFADLLVWFHLAMLGETVRRGDARVQTLMAQEAAFNAAERTLLIEIMHQQIDGIIGRYRALADRGAVELAMNPYAHPILPLLLDLRSAREALPDLPLPTAECYPGGEQRAHWQIAQGLAVFERHFQRRPVGCWPAEGAISTATARLFGEHGFSWIASGHGVLAHSLPEAPDPHRPYQLEGSPAIVFRDDALSDRIGFEYASWHSDDAAADLVQHLLNIHGNTPNPSQKLVAIIMDGENAWEYYYENAYHFFGALYRRLADEPRLELTTFSDALPRFRPHRLERLVAGSWIYGTLSTWIGEPQKNAAWDLLVTAKQEFDAVIAAATLSVERVAAATQALGRCEASDWWWWFGRDTDPRIAHEFDMLFRAHLRTLYHLLDRPVPAAVDLSLVEQHDGGGTVGSMRRGTAP